MIPEMLECAKVYGLKVTPQFCGESYRTAEHYRDNIDGIYFCTQRPVTTWVHPRCLDCPTGAQHKDLPPIPKKKKTYTVTKPNTNRVTRNWNLAKFALTEGWASEREMWLSLIKAHKYGREIARVLCITPACITYKMHRFGLEFQDGRRVMREGR